MERCLKVKFSDNKGYEGCGLGTLGPGGRILIDESGMVCHCLPSNLQMWEAQNM